METALLEVLVDPVRAACFADDQSYTFVDRGTRYVGARVVARSEPHDQPGMVLLTFNFKRKEEC